MALPLRFLVRMVPMEEQPQAPFVRTLKSLAQSVGGRAINAKWTSYGAVEIDVLLETRPDFDLFLATAEPLAKLEFFRDLNEAPKFKPKEETIAEATEYFDAERYWEAHEELESVWRVSSGPEKTLLQGIILVCAAHVHHQKGEEDVALGVLRRARKQLDWGEAMFHGVDIARLRNHVDDVLKSGRFEIFRL